MLCVAGAAAQHDHTTHLGVVGLIGAVYRAEAPRQIETASLVQSRLAAAQTQTQTRAGVFFAALAEQY